MVSQNANKKKYRQVTYPPPPPFTHTKKTTPSTTTWVTTQVCDPFARRRPLEPHRPQHPRRLHRWTGFGGSPEVARLRAAGAAVLKVRRGRLADHPSRGQPQSMLCGQRLRGVSTAPAVSPCACVAVLRCFFFLGTRNEAAQRPWLQNNHGTL